MYFLISAIAIILVFSFFYRLIIPKNQADFSDKAILDARSLKLAIISLASSCSSPRPSGQGVSIRLIKKYCEKFFKLISERCRDGNCLEFENRLYDSFYQIRDKIAYLKSQTKKLKSLPHCSKYPRIYEFCQLLVKSTGGALTKQVLSEMLNEYNDITPLSQFEINALPLVLELVLLELFAIYCKKAIEIERVRFLAERDASKNQIDLSSLYSDTYIYYFIKRSDFESETALDSIAQSNDVDIKNKASSFELLVSNYDAAVESAIVTLSNIKIWLTDEFLLAHSPMNNILKGEDVVYKECTMPTKNVYLFHIAKKAKRQKKGELALTREIITAAQNNKKDIAYYILPSAGSRAKMRLFILGIVLFSLSLCLGVTLILDRLWISITLAALFFPSAVAITLMIVTELNARIAFRRFLPRIEQPDGKTLIVFCGLAMSEKDVTELFANLQIIRYANPDNNFRYGLLLDLPAGMEKQEKDEKILSLIKSEFSKLKEDKYNIFVRKRKKIEGEDKFQGWEKKRGALINLNEYLLNQDKDEFSLILGDYSQPKYVITLDSDTMINCAKELVQIMEHPHNKNKTIVSLSAKTNPYTATTAFARLMCGAIGLDSYSSQCAEANYDLFDSGNYTGKGIYRLEEYNKILKDFFPDNKILSHDFIEGAVAGCGSAECALDTFPANFSQFLTRSIRWLRGDWQLLPYLFKRVKNRKGEKINNPISPIAKWHIFCNMLFSLLPVTALASIIISLFSSRPLIAITISLGYYILQIFNSLRFSIISLKNPLGDIFRTLFNISVLPIAAIYNFCAINLTLLRLVRGKKLLEWAAFAHAKGKANILPNILLSAALIAVTLVLRLNPVFIYISGLFLLGIVFISLLNVGYKQKNYSSQQLSLKLTELARKTWGYFAQNKGLIFDNYQEHLDKGFADRTSPTNIGFSLLAAISALELGIINENQCQSHIELIISSLEKMEKWHGHIYNWSDLNGNPLYPKYISSVDSGNLLACLLVIEQYCKNSLQKRVQKLIEQMDFSVLYDKKRELLYIGYNHSLKIYDGHYDLMASESLLTYIVAVGCGKIPKKSIENLSRSGLKAYNKVALASWTGGAFEYLMINIFMRYPNGMLFRSAKAAINAHKRYAKINNLAFWGCSESQYNYTDNNGNYQYKAFGVPAISNSNHAGGRVVAPYASLLALCYDAKSVEKNLEKIDSLGLMGQYGYYESLDGGDKLIKTFMAHHQGMIMASICNFLCDDVIIKKLRSNPAIAAAELLLTGQEFTAVSKKKKPLKERYHALDKDILVAKTHPIRVNILSNGRYSAGFDSQGASFSVYKDKYISWYEQGQGGLKIFFAEADSTSELQQPAISGNEFLEDSHLSQSIGQVKHRQSSNFMYNFEAAKDFAIKNSPNRYDFLGKKYNWQDISQGKIVFSQHKTTYEYQTNNFLINQTAIVLPNICGEMRKISIKNITNSKKSFVIGSYIQPVLCERRQHLSHKQFSAMKIRTSLKGDVLTCYRNDQRESLFLAHYFDIGGVEYESSGSNLKFGTNLPSFGSPIYPVLSGKKSITLRAGEKIELSVFLLVSEDMDSLLRAVNLTKNSAYFMQAMTAAYSYNKLHGIGRRAKDLFSAICFADQIQKHEFGTRPLVVLEIGEVPELLKEQLEELKIIQSFVEFEVAILYKEVPGYFKKVFDKITYYIEQSGLKFVHAVNTFMENERAENLKKAAVKEVIFYKVKAEESKKAIYDNVPMAALKYDLQLGSSGFLKDSSYFIENNFEHRPWSNVIGSNKIGTIITDNGGGYTFYKNSGINKITYWSNDPISDKVSEGVILSESGINWSITKKPLTKECKYFCRHGFGYTEFTCNYNGIIALQSVFTDMGRCKYTAIKLRNFEPIERKIKITKFLNLVMGDSRENSIGYIDVSGSSDGIKAHNRLNDATIFCTASQEINSYIWNNKEYILSTEQKQNHNQDITFTNLNNVLELPCVAINTTVILPPLSQTEVVFCLQAQPENSPKSRQSLLDDAKTALKASKDFYSNVSNVEIETQDKAVNHFLKWLPYQILSCRFFARAGFYQAGGAIGFRDQLQDCLALLFYSSKLVRNHILECAASQFEEGDVMHWWHPPRTGVRTRITDDLLYLPWITAEYIRFTGDKDILDEVIPFLKARTLNQGENDLYFSPTSGKSGTLYEHCIRAIKYNKIAENGLIYMGGGDWNDAMDKVGILGKGTSVWCSIFLYFVINKFLPLVKDAALRKELVETAHTLKNGVQSCWDGEWFLRAFMDNGTILGSHKSSECQIDLISQSWAALSDITDKNRIKTALKSAADRLVDFENGVIKLLDPPFEYIDAGYICKYPKGVRENGGQYTHGAIWYIMALLKEECADFAYSLLEMLNPINHCKTESGRKRYMAEPYVLCGDVYSGDFAGVGGWSWYTGAAGWYYKCFVEDVLGIKLSGKKMSFEPNLPQKLKNIKIKYKTDFGELDIEIDNTGLGDWTIFVGKVKYNLRYLMLTPSLKNKKIVIKRS